MEIHILKNEPITKVFTFSKEGQEQDSYCAASSISESMHQFHVCIAFWTADFQNMLVRCS